MRQQQKLLFAFSCQPVPYLLYPILCYRFDVFGLEGIHLSDAGDDIYIRRLASKRRSEPDPVADVQHQEDGERNVRSQKVPHAPLARKKDREAICQCQNDQNQQRDVRCVWLERSLVRKALEQVAELHGLTESEVCDDADDPGNETTDGGDVDKPVKGHRARFTHTEEGQQADCPGCQYRVVGHTQLSGL